MKKSPYRFDLLLSVIIYQGNLVEMKKTIMKKKKPDVLI